MPINDIRHKKMTKHKFWGKRIKIGSLNTRTTHKKDKKCRTMENVLTLTQTYSYSNSVDPNQTFFQRSSYFRVNTVRGLYGLYFGQLDLMLLYSECPTPQF